VQRASRGEAILSIALSPNGRILATGDRRSDIRLWTDDVGREPELIRRGRYANDILGCSPDGRWVAAWDGIRVLLISIDGRERTLEFEGHRRGVTSVGFSPDAGKFLTGDWDASVLLWRVPPRK
jgi:WD40 repeat protein